MPTDKEIKREFKLKASKAPNKYYAVEVLKKEGFERKKCKCGTYFWTTTDSKVCGDPSCSGGFRFIGKSPASKELDYIGVWKEFARLFSKWGYTPIKRYPVAARWRDDTDFVQASIYDFQPWVVSGEVTPPANPLVVPQFCLRFNDIDNVGITGAHYTGFVMIGQHAFMQPKDWNQEKYFTDIHNWLKQGLGLKNKDIIFHEDAWAGGGNFGPCMEYFSAGLELGNQVYMMYEQTASGAKELNLKVLDMGMGHERNSWFTQGAPNSYETTFPTVCKKLYSATGIKIDKSLMKKFLPYSSYLNVDEVENIDKVWEDVAKKINIGVIDLKDKILPLAALYSVGEHTRALLVALADGALPGNVKGGYNLRVILRRALSFIDKYNWNIDLKAVAEWHADYLKKLFPELNENIENVKKILDVEKHKYESTKQKARRIVDDIIKTKVSESKLLELYDSRGISPELIQEEAAKLEREVKVPDDFYSKIALLHEKKEQAAATVKETKLDLKNITATKALYFDDYSKVKFKAKIIKVVGHNIVLDKTYFYPTSGGQIHDIGTISLLRKETGSSHPPHAASESSAKIVDVFKQGDVIIHVLDKAYTFLNNQEVSCEVDFNRRKLLAQLHTATHVVNSAAKKVLGGHINQAGAKKTVEKAHLDITHYQSISEEELNKIEEEANKIVKKGIPVHTEFMKRDKAEKKYGMSIYQGGAVPGNLIRIVEILGVDVEACAGTHLKNTSEIGNIKLLGSTKIQDGVVRLSFVAGSLSKESDKEESGLVKEISKVLGVSASEIPARAQELFDKWKKARKAFKKGKKISLKELELIIKKKFEGDILDKTAEIFKTQKEYIAKTASRFLKELEEFKEKLK